MPSDPEIYLAKTLSDLQEELGDGFASLKRELSEEHESAIRRLESTSSSAPKFKKKSKEKQFEAEYSSPRSRSVGRLIPQICATTSEKP